MSKDENLFGRSQEDLGKSFKKPKKLQSHKPIKHGKSKKVSGSPDKESEAQNNKSKRMTIIKQGKKDEIGLKKSSFAHIEIEGTAKESLENQRKKELKDYKNMNKKERQGPKKKHSLSRKSSRASMIDQED